MHGCELVAHGCELVAGGWRDLETGCRKAASSDGSLTVAVTQYACKNSSLTYASEAGRCAAMDSVADGRSTASAMLGNC